MLPHLDNGRAYHRFMTRGYPRFRMQDPAAPDLENGYDSVERVKRMKLMWARPAAGSAAGTGSTDATTPATTTVSARSVVRRAWTVPGIYNLASIPCRTAGRRPGRPRAVTPERPITTQLYLSGGSGSH
jgi:hypothetical protein